MRKLVMFAAPTIVGYLWNRRKRSAPQAAMAAAATPADLSQPQRQTEAMESAVDVPGGIRP
jgi:hypothetical protein